VEFMVEGHELPERQGEDAAAQVFDEIPGSANC
jgi:hypothetical protein